MEYSYQNSVIAQILEAIINASTYEGETGSNIADILLSILNETPYEGEANSVLAELFLKLKAKIEGDPFTPYEGTYSGHIAEILLSILNETEYTNEPQSRIAELLLQLKEELETYTEVTKSGAISNFETNVSKPLVNLTAYVKATQEAGTPTPQSPKAISGVSSVSVTKCEKNLFNDVAWFTDNGYTLQTDGSWYKATTPLNVVLWENSTGYSGRIAIHFQYKYAVDNAQGFRIVINYTDGTSTTVYTSNTTTFATKEVTTASGKTVKDIRTSYGSNIGSYIKDFCINLSGYDYEPYNGNTTLINLGGTYYGGEFTQDKNGKRAFKVTHVAYDDWENKDVGLYGINTHGIANFYFNHVSQLTVANVGICNLLTKQTKLFSDTTDEGFLVNPNTQYIRLFSTRASTVDEFKTWATNNDLLIINELATPYTIDLTDGEPISAFVGVNNVFNDSGDTSVTYLYKGEPPLQSPLLGFGLGSSSEDTNEPDENEDTPTEETPTEETENIEEET